MRDSIGYGGLEEGVAVAVAVTGGGDDDDGKLHLCSENPGAVIFSLFSKALTSLSLK